MSLKQKVALVGHVCRHILGEKRATFRKQGIWKHTNRWGCDLTPLESKTCQIWIRRTYISRRERRMIPRLGKWFRREGMSGCIFNWWSLEKKLSATAPEEVGFCFSLCQSFSSGYPAWPLTGLPLIYLAHWSLASFPFSLLAGGWAGWLRCSLAGAQTISLDRCLLAIDFPRHIFCPGVWCWSHLIAVARIRGSAEGCFCTRNIPETSNLRVSPVTLSSLRAIAILISCMPAASSG